MEDHQDSDSSFTTISEHSTTDTSINSTPNRCPCNCCSDRSLSDSDSSDSDSSDSDSSDSDSDSDLFSDSDDNESSSVSSDSDLSEWDVTNSIEFPTYAPKPTRDFLKEYAWSLVLIRPNKRYGEFCFY